VAVIPITNNYRSLDLAMIRKIAHEANKTDLSIQNKDATEGRRVLDAFCKASHLTIINFTYLFIGDIDETIETCNVVSGASACVSMRLGSKEGLLVTGSVRFWRLLAHQYDKNKDLNFIVNHLEQNGFK